MTTMSDPVTDDAVTVAADLTIRQHQGDGSTWRPGACRQRRPDGPCPQLVWALSERQRLREQAHTRTTQTTPPAPSGGNPTADAPEGDTA